MEISGTGSAASAAAAHRATSRAERVATGLVELEQWLLDQIRGGLAGLDRLGYAHFDAMAARMVDAQAPGVAGLLRALPAELATEGWPARMLEQLGALHLLVRAHQRLTELPPELAATVRSRVGYPVSKAEVLAGAGVLDDWYALGMVDTVEYRLETRRVWLYGAATKRWAVYLSFAPSGGELDSSVLAGQRLRGRLHFYPGSGQYRALVGEREHLDGPWLVPAAGSCQAAQERYAELLAADPWATRMPAVLAATPMPPTGSSPWRLRDAAGCWVAAAEKDQIDWWPLVAESRGAPVPVFGEWQAESFRPLRSVAGATAG